MANGIDLKNVHPISKAASSLAKLLGQARQTGAPIVVTQKGYPTGVLISVERYAQLVEAEERQAAAAPALPFTPPFSLDEEIARR
jgi:prevent-host-death family protein